MVKKATSGEEYKVLKQKPLPKKIANVFIFLWFIAVMCPTFYLVFKKSDLIKEYAVVKAVYETNDLLQNQYKTLSDNLLKQIDISKYTSKIEIPEIKLDTVSKTTTQVNQVSGQLSKLGIKEASKVASASAELQKKVDKVNVQIETAVKQTQKTLESDIQSALQKEVSSFADGQVQKQLNISAKAYNALSKNQFGLMTKKGQEATAFIYQELSKTKLSLIKNVITSIDFYFKWIVLGFAGLLLIILLIPPVFVWWVAKKLSKTFTQCPYCNKVFLTKANGLGLLKMLNK